MRIKMPKFIIIEWIDWSWKTIQVKMLQEYYESIWKKVLVLDYLRYEDESCIWVKRYLGGEYGEINSVSLYQASMFYAMDRVDNYLKKLRDIWNNYDIVLWNRSTTSNLIHQWAKILENLHTQKENWAYFSNFNKDVSWTMYWFKEWLENLEYRDLELPSPNKVIFLNVKPKTSLKNIDTRWNKKDLHENIDHLTWAYKSAQFWVENSPNWKNIECINKEDWKMFNKVKINDSIIKEINL